jgi:hypothetical protein
MSYYSQGCDERMEKLGRMKKIDDLRSIWPHEEVDFSKWLAAKENLE